MDCNAALRRNSHMGTDDDPVHLILVEVDGIPWTAAHDGSMVFACAGHLDGAEALRSDSPVPPVVSNFVREAQSPSLITVDLESLRAIAGAHQPVTSKPCTKCNGTGTVCSCGECECMHCDEGKIYVYPDTRLGYVFDRFVDLNRLARLLDGVDGDVRARPDGDARSALIFAGPGWVATMMPVAPEAAVPSTNYPRWDARCTL